MGKDASTHLAGRMEPTKAGKRYPPTQVIVTKCGGMVNKCNVWLDSRPINTGVPVKERANNRTSEAREYWTPKEKTTAPFMY